jgi:hypothetical protein
LQRVKYQLRETEQALTPFGGLVVFLEFVNRIGFVSKVIECMPVVHRSPNSTPPAQTWVAFLISVVAGARRFQAVAFGPHRNHSIIHSVSGSKNR